MASQIRGSTQVDGRPANLEQLGAEAGEHQTVSPPVSTRKRPRANAPQA